MMPLRPALLAFAVWTAASAAGAAPPHSIHSPARLSIHAPSKSADVFRFGVKYTPPRLLIPEAIFNPAMHAFNAALEERLREMRRLAGDLLGLLEAERQTRLLQIAAADRTVENQIAILQRLLRQRAQGKSAP